MRSVLLLATAAVVFASPLAACTTSDARTDVVDAFDSTDDAVVKEMCASVLALSGGATSRDVYEADLASMSDEDLESVFAKAGGAGIPDGVQDYDGDQLREWQLATWDECVERGHIGVARR